VHVPFCAGKCVYCGFYSVPGAGAELQRRYLAAVGRELDILQRGNLRLLPRTLYFGGGTPSMLGADGLRALAGRLHDHVDMSKVGEWTCELTPATATPKIFAALRGIGVTRVSMGVQTFDPEVAGSLGRHGADVAACVRNARVAGFENIGFDLIAGLPGVSKRKWNKDLETAIILQPDHISVYALNVEEGSALVTMARDDPACLPSDELLLLRLTMAEERFCAAGFSRYEISNYARPGKKCRHHVGVWRGEDFVGVGPAAVSRAGLLRWSNAPDVEDYVERLERDLEPAREHNELDETSDACERAFTALRLGEGWDAAACAQHFPVLAPHAARFVETLQGLSQHGLVAEAEGRWRLTRRGREVADAVTRELLRCV